MEKEEWFEQIVKLLPEGWQEKAIELKAFRRAREIKSPKQLLKCILLYLTEGTSFAKTSALLSLSGEVNIVKMSLYERMRNSREWLKWLCQNICRQAGLIAPKPLFLENRNVILVDGTDEVKCGVRKQCYKLHYALDLFSLSARELLLTNNKTGEKLVNFKSFSEQDIVMGDRAYGTLKGISYLRSLKADYILRINSGKFNFYLEEGQRTSLFERLAYLKEGESADIRVKCLIDKHYQDIRICALRKDGGSEQAGVKRLVKSNQRKLGGRKLSKKQMENNKYVLVATSVGDEVSSDEILALYELRWQIEILFKRLKSLFHYNDLPANTKNDVDESSNDYAYAWFYGKLLLAALCETIVNKGRFSP
jgi:hypothetical protein